MSIELSTNRNLEKYQNISKIAFWLALWIRTIGEIAIYPACCLIGFLLLSISLYHVPHMVVFISTVCFVSLIITIPLMAAFIFLPGQTWLERRVRERSVSRARKEIFGRYGMTPERYIKAQIGLIERGYAAYRLDIELSL